MTTEAPKIDVVVGVSSKRLFWKTVGAALKRQPDFRVHHPTWLCSIDRLIRRRRARILVLEIPSAGTADECQRYLDRHPGLTVVGLDPDCADLIVRKRDIGLKAFAQLIRNLAGDEGSQDGERRSGVCLVSPDDVERFASVGGGGSEVDSDEPRVDDALRWVHVCLHQRLALAASADDDGGTPAWAMTARRARSLLCSEFGRMSDRQLRRARAEIEGSLFAQNAVRTRCGVTWSFLDTCEAFSSPNGAASGELTEAERRMLLLALAPEIDGNVARVFGFLNDDLTRKRPTPTVLAELVFGGEVGAFEVRKLLADHRPSGMFGLVAIEATDPQPGAEAALVPAPELSTFLLASKGYSPRYGSSVEVLPPDSADRSTVGTADGDGEIHDLLVRWDSVPSTEEAPIVQVARDPATRQRFVEANRAAGKCVVVFDLSAVADLNPVDLRSSCLAACRVARLHRAVLLVQGRERLAPDRRRFFDAHLLPEIHQRIRHLAVYGDAWILSLRGPVWLMEKRELTIAARAEIWQRRTRAAGIKLSEADARDIASIVRFGEREINATLRLCRGGGTKRKQLRAAARHVARAAVPSNVRVLEPGFDWKDIVLPADVLSQLKQIPKHVRYAGTVLEDWGYAARLPYGQGVAALFSGPSGVGKTMAAQIIADDLGVDLFQVDLSKTVSKYIGETEKNLEEAFCAAESANAVLVFDEADALWGKRTSVRDAHDRHANVEVAYLLQRMEAYGGLAILTTNLRQNLDQAFTRRLRFSIDFPAPNPKDREAIWQRVFPPGAPLSENVDFGLLARRLDLTGGNIQQIALRAAFAAAAEEGAIEMRHVVRATLEEARKLGMASAERSLAQLAA